MMRRLFDVKITRHVSLTGGIWAYHRLHLSVWYFGFFATVGRILIKKGYMRFFGQILEGRTRKCSRSFESGMKGGTNILGIGRKGQGVRLLATCAPMPPRRLCSPRRYPPSANSGQPRVTERNRALHLRHVLPLLP